MRKNKELFIINLKNYNRDKIFAINVILSQKNDQIC